MTTTSLIAKIVGPVLLLRAVSILLDRQHFVGMLNGFEHEVGTISFSFFPIALLMAGIAISVLHTDRSSLAAVLIRLMGWGAIAKASALILAPGLVASKIPLLQRAGVLNLVLLATCLLGGYFTWFGYARPEAAPSGKAAVSA